MPTVDREGLAETLADALRDMGVEYPFTDADALIAGPLAPILAQADTAAQAVADRDEYAEYIIDLECKATRDAGQIARLSAEVEALRAERDGARQEADNLRDGLATLIAEQVRDQRTALAAAQEGKTLIARAEGGEHGQ